MVDTLARELDDQSQSGDVDADTAQHLAGPPFDVEYPDQEVLRIYLGVAPLQRQAGCSVDRAASSGRQLRIAYLARVSRADGLGHFGSGRVRGGAGRHYCLLRMPFDSNEAEQEVLGADVRVIELTRLFLGDLEYTTGALAEAFHGRHHDNPRVRQLLRRWSGLTGDEHLDGPVPMPDPDAGPGRRRDVEL